MKNQLTMACCCAGLILGLTACGTSRPKEASIDLFNGKNLKGWKSISEDPSVPMDKVWSVENGIITCTGTPLGAIYRGPDVTNFRLVVEYRWAGEKPGNSGIFSRIDAPLKPLPKAIETQLMHGNAGDVLGLQGKKVAGGQERFFEIKAHKVAGDITGVRKTSDAEKPAGEWNRVEILAEGSRYTVYVNGKLVNQVDGVEVSSGPIGLQSEGGAIQFRRVTLIPLP